jgi:hypothetical protein
MPTPLTRTSWPLGWNPSMDASNGAPEGLLRMDNLQQDEQGVISLARGNTTLNGGAFAGFVDRIASKNINGTDFTWVALTRSTSGVLRSNNDFASNTTVGSAGGERAAFGDCLGQILVAAGDIKKKDDGTTINDLGITTPGVGPTVTLHNQPTLELWHGIWSLIEGHDPFTLADPDLSYKAFTDSSTLRASFRETYASPIDTTDIDTGAAGDPSLDSFQFIIQPQDTSLFRNIRIEFILDDDPTLGKNYYWVDIPVDLTQAEFRLGLDVFSTLSVRRQDFTRQGEDQTLDWTHVTAINFIATAISDC